MRTKRNKKIVTGIVVVILMILGISQIKFKSVDTYKQEQKVLLEEEQALFAESEMAADVENTIKPANISGTGASLQNDEKEEEPLEIEDNKKAAKVDKKEEKNSKTKENSSEKNNIEKEEVEQNSGEQKSKLEKKNKTEQKNTNNKQNKNNKSASIKVTKKPVSTPTTNTQKEKTEQKKYVTCKVEIDCSVLLNNMENVDETMKVYIPENGKILEETEIKEENGKTAYDVLIKACKLYDIACDADFSAYSGCYVKGIGYLYEKKAGSMSGWIYQVNGKSPNVSASQYKLQEGDVVSWIYTCTGKAGS